MCGSADDVEVIFAWLPDSWWFFLRCNWPQYLHLIELSVTLMHRTVIFNSRLASTLRGPSLVNSFNPVTTTYPLEKSDLQYLCGESLF